MSDACWFAGIGMDARHWCNLKTSPGWTGEDARLVRLLWRVVLQVKGGLTMVKNGTQWSRCARIRVFFYLNSF